MQAGAQDFFVKPASPERILVGVRNALQMTQLTAEVGRLKKHVAGRTTFDDLVGDSRADAAWSSRWAPAPPSPPSRS